MRFQPSWIVESLPPGEPDSLFIPLAPRATSLLWFKRLGLKMYVNDPVESRGMLLRALLQNQGELFSEPNRKKFNQSIEKPLGLSMNPFKAWEGRPFSREQLDYLFFWREAALEISEIGQRQVFWAAVHQVMAYWVGLGLAPKQAQMAPDEAMGYILGKQNELIFAGQEPVFSLCLPMSELGDEVEASVLLLPLPIQEKIRPEWDLDILFHAWFRGNGDLLAARSEMDEARRGWVQKWDASPDYGQILSKVGKARYCVVSWSGSDLPPRLHEEMVANPFRNAFARLFPSSRLLMKTAQRQDDSYDFLLIMQR